MAQNIRDLLQGPPHPSEATTLRTLASETVTERTILPDENPSFTARLPGDAGSHPLANTGQNPFPGVGIQEVARRVREGAIQDPTVERQARAYIDQFQRLDGQSIYDGRNHEFEEPEIEHTYSPAAGAGIGGLRRADRFPNYEDSHEHVEQVIAQNQRARPPQVASTPIPKIDASNEEAVLESLWRKT